MPFPMRLARMNRWLANPIARPIARRLPPLAVVHHVGRTSGRRYATPVMAFRSGERLTVALTYGPETQWVRNVFAAGGAEIEQGGSRRRVTDPAVIPVADVLGGLPLIVRVVLRRLRVAVAFQLTLDPA